jgi:hypothetical protein
MKKGSTAMNREDRSANIANVHTSAAKPPTAEGLLSKALGGLPEHEKARLFDGSIVGTAQEAVDFITNILESSTEYSVIAKDLTGTRQRKSGEQFTARVVITPRSDPTGKPIGFLLISKDISDEIRLTQYARSLIEASVDPLVTISPESHWRVS